MPCPDTVSSTYEVLRQHRNFSGILWTFEDRRLPMDSHWIPLDDI